MSNIKAMIAVLAVTLSVVSIAGEIKTVAELQKKHLEACGGEKYLKMKGLYVEGKMASKEMTAKFHIAIEFPGRMALKTLEKHPTIFLMDKTRVMTGYRSRDGIILSLIEEPEDNTENKMLQDPFHLTRLTTYFPKASLEADEKVDGTDCYHVRANASDKAEEDYHYYFDKSTFLFKCVRAKLKTMNNAPVEAVVKKYETKDGLPLVQLVAVTLGDGRRTLAVDITLSKAVLNPDKKPLRLFDNETFVVTVNLHKGNTWTAMDGRYDSVEDMLKDIQFAQSFGFVPSFNVWLQKSTSAEEREAIIKKFPVKPKQVKP